MEADEVFEIEREQDEENEEEEDWYSDFVDEQEERKEEDENQKEVETGNNKSKGHSRIPKRFRERSDARYRSHGEESTFGKNFYA